MRSTSSLLLLALAVGAAQPVVRSLPRFDWYARAELGYDDNIFRYSPDDLALFRSSEQPARFPFRSADDLDLSVGAGMKYRYARGRNWGHLWLRTRVHGLASNWQKSYGWTRLELVQAAWPGGRLEAGLLWMPSFLVRYYRPAGSSEYRECRFAELLGTVGLRQRFGRLTVNPEYGFELDDYLAEFDYYDTRAHRLAGRLGFEVARGLDVEAEYRFKAARAAGPVPDISYDEHGGRVSVRTRPARWPRLGVEVAYGMDRRAFRSSDPEQDPAHAGRVDLVGTGAAELSYDFGPVRVLVGYTLDWREAASPFSETIDDIKQYHRNVLTLGAVFSPGDEE